MYTPTYNTEEVLKNNRIMNIAQRRFADEIRNTNTLDPFLLRGEYTLTRAEKKHLWWSFKWLVVVFVLASIATYFINKL